MAKSNTQEDFFKRIDKETHPDCWLWIGTITSKGYGHFKYDGKTWLTHRLCWVFENGTIPDGLCVLHHCDNPRCVNPSHLFLGTIQDNHTDMDAKGRRRFPIGEAASRAQLTDEKVVEIREFFKANPMTYKELGSHFGLDKRHVFKIIKGMIWRHVKK